MASKVNANFIDHDVEKSSVSFLIEEIVELNYDELLGVGGTVDTTLAAIAGVSIGTYSKKQVIAQDVAISSAPPANKFAQRENKWLVTYVDDTNGKQYQMTIPCANLDLLQPNSREMNTASGAGATLVAALEAGLRTPDDNGITVTKIIHVGRNL